MRLDVKTKKIIQFIMRLDVKTKKIIQFVNFRYGLQLRKLLPMMIQENRLR